MQVNITSSITSVKTSYQQLNGVRGVGMIEILVSLVILSIGLLGIATLQLIASFNNVEALSRSQAVLVAEQVAERLRVSSVITQNANGKVIDDAYVDARLYNFGNLSCHSDASEYDCFCQSFPATLSNCHINQCHPAQLAAFDAYQLSCASIQHNPNMNLEVTCNDSNTSDLIACSAGSRYTIMLSWPAAHWQHPTITNHSCDELISNDNNCLLLELFL
jgi:type IV pilus assembly protein PilV